MPFIESRQEFINRHDAATKDIGPPVPDGHEWLWPNGASIDKSFPDDPRVQSMGLREPHPNPLRRWKVIERYWTALGEQYADEFARVRENIIAATKMAAGQGFPPPWQVEPAKKRMGALREAVHFCQRKAEEAREVIDRLEGPNVSRHEERVAKAREEAELTLQAIRSIRL